MIGLQSLLLKEQEKYFRLFPFFLERRFLWPPSVLQSDESLSFTALKEFCFHLKKKVITQQMSANSSSPSNHCVFYDDDADALLLKIFQKGNRPHSRSHGWALPWHHCIIFAWLKANFSSSSRSAQATSAWIFWASRIRKPHLPSNHKMCVCRKVNSFFNYNSKKYRARLCKAKSCWEVGGNCESASGAPLDFSGEKSL